MTGCLARMTPDCFDFNGLGSRISIFALQINCADIARSCVLLCPGCPRHVANMGISKMRVSLNDDQGEICSYV